MHPVILNLLTKKSSKVKNSCKTMIGLGLAIIITYNHKLKLMILKVGALKQLTIVNYLFNFFLLVS